MQIENSSPGNHSPANDAVRCLAVLSGLVSVASFPLRIETFTLPSGVTLLYRLPQLRDCGPHTKYPFSARVTTVDGGVLPSGYKTPYSLAQLFARYELVAVGLNCQKYRISQKGVRFWWFSFPNREVLDRFTSEVHGMTLHDEELIVI
ncbi:hypothetical protein EJ08DRAFT_646933 [Tothia fuscella]|uniref:Uncharacterized protein n=1 Tax=Tothia fuscella TaxID=1048955 RepID=A0A9P4U213_9PEZI|nr:hypothetical protein EJ08DRAFT_646933 [Tothia fuscella]